LSPDGPRDDAPVACADGSSHVEMPPSGISTSLKRSEKKGGRSVPDCQAEPESQWRDRAGFAPASWVLPPWLTCVFAVPDQLPQEHGGLAEIERHPTRANAASICLPVLWGDKPARSIRIQRLHRRFPQNDGVYVRNGPGQPDGLVGPVKTCNRCWRLEHEPGADRKRCTLPAGCKAHVTSHAREPRPNGAQRAARSSPVPLKRVRTIC
jgi:hypothetical protein